MGNADSKVAAEEAPPESALPHNKQDAATSGAAGAFHEEKKEAEPSTRKNKTKTPKTPKTRGGRGHGEGGAPVMTRQVPEEQVHVNMPMADLMAYLQVVANNSNHLPLTRRDDPELDRTVSTLSPEDYAQKAAAFIPSDVRVIGGTYTRYGRVWDLPTTEEYNPSDAMHEPGCSYGGACTNTMLKVLYDAANVTLDATYQDAVVSSLFDDDDDEGTEDGQSIMGKSFKSGFSLDHAASHTSSLSWVDLLRKMKAEMKEMEYAQTPLISSTRKMDLSKPFSFLPENFDPSKNKKRALLIGCGYKNVPEAELKASHDDVRSMKDYIVNVHGFSESGECMTVLLDGADHKHPTFENITEAFKTLSEQCQAGDAVFVMFSGHGGRILDSHSDEEAESYDEVIAPVDYQTSGVIRDTLIFKTLLAPLRYGVTLTLLVDTCDTGMVMDLPYAWTTKKDKREAIPKLAVNDDFSFVRFLKVVKTLYESSTFTQLGLTVKTVLQDNEEEVVEVDSSRDTEDEFDRARVESMFETIAKACLLSTESSSKGGSKKGRKGGDEGLLEQVINTCSVFTNPEGDLDEEGNLTMRSSPGNHSDYEDDRDRSSFETYSDDEFDHKPSRTKRHHV